MKKSLQSICLFFVALVIGFGLKLMYAFPVDTQPYVEKKYEGWNGVLQAWVCSDWESSGSFIRWLNSCAAEFEKSHNGVYLEFTPVTVDALADISFRKPDLLFFSPGTLTNPYLLTPLQSNSAIRSDLQSYGKGHSLPIALGGYIWAYNTALCNVPPRNADEVASLTIPIDQKGYCYSAAVLGLLSELSDGEATIPLPFDTGIDLGLPALAIEEILFSEGALDLFINGNLPYVPVSSHDLTQLARLRDSGKGPDWKLFASGSIACSNQLLMGGIPVQHAGSECSRLAEGFLLYLLSSDCQSRLADIGAHAVTGERIHPDFSIHAELDALLNSRPLWLPACFSEYSAANSEAIVRGFLNKDFTVKNALDLLGFEGM